MRIDNWPLDRVMRLPDWCFGRRWWVGDQIAEAAGDAAFLMGGEDLPDKFVVWGVYVSCWSPNCLAALKLTIRLGDHVPADNADARTMERVLKGISIITGTHELKVLQNGVTWINCERLVLESAGRKLAYAAEGDGAIQYQITAGILISSMPKEVPDWLISGQGKNQF